MSIEKLLSELNEEQRQAATFNGRHALVLAGAGCGKTKTIVARAAYLLSEGVSPSKIQILTFTRRAASEVVYRVKLAMGERSHGLNASTFHSWCTSIIKGNPNFFGLKNFTVIDRDDQLQLIKVLKGKDKEIEATPANICDIYSFARNTRKSLKEALLSSAPELYIEREQLAKIMQAFEEKKRERNYLDYDDILEIVAGGIAQYPDLCKWLANKVEHLLVDEMQDTNPLQWELLQPLTDYSKLFCVGDDAQSIYGFRGADFKNVHHFSKRVPESVTLRLENNYRSTQEILDLSNWLLQESPLSYGKQLKAVRGNGIKPRLETFEDEWETGRWIADNLCQRFKGGAAWSQHMILVRSAYAARTIEQSLLSKNIPYRFIGGHKLLESAHVKDVLSSLRVVANFRDELGWMRFLTLWPGIGEVTASTIINQMVVQNSFEECLTNLSTHRKIPDELTQALNAIVSSESGVGAVFRTASRLMGPILSEKYKSQNWDKRKRDLQFVGELADRHSSILDFIEEYVLNPVYNSEIEDKANEDSVDLITIHSAKGTEREVCYVVNVSPGAFPSYHAKGDSDQVEEERRVLYVALTRAQNELIITRRLADPRDTDDSDDAFADVFQSQNATPYFFNQLPIFLVDEEIHDGIGGIKYDKKQLRKPKQIKYGIDLS